MSSKIKKGDKVQILLGKDRGKTGSVEHVNLKVGKAFLPGLNVYKRHVRKYREIKGGIIDLSKSVNLSNLGLICPNCNKVTRVGFKYEGDLKVRVCKKCKKEIK